MQHRLDGLLTRLSPNQDKPSGGRGPTIPQRWTQILFTPSLEVPDGAPERYSCSRGTLVDQGPRVHPSA